jgi:hypothetical protein
MTDHEKAEEHVEDLEVPEEQSEDVTGGVLIGLLLPAIQKAPPNVQQGPEPHINPGAKKGFTGGV